jgi:GT2 family glycosyltransferase
MPGPRIAIVTPSLDQGRFIEATLASVHGQGLAAGELQHLVFDAGSVDETLAVLARWRDRVRWVSEPDRGQSHAVNKGFAAARADVIGWLNSDDVYLPGALPAVLETFEARPDADVVVGDAVWLDEDGAVLGPYPVGELTRAALLERCAVAQPAIFFRRRLLQRVGPLDERLHYAMDYDYWLRIVRTAAVVVRLRRPLAGCRSHAAAKSMRAGARQALEVMEILGRHGAVADHAIRGYVRAALEERGLGAGEHPVFHRLLGGAWAHALALRFGPRTSAALLRWQLGFVDRRLRGASRA